MQALIKIHSSLIAELVTAAKTGLNIVSKSKKLPDDVKLAIWQWHYDRLHPVTNDSVNIISHDVQLESVNILSQDAYNDAVEIVSQPDGNESVELYSQPNDLDVVRIAFYVTKNGVRTRQVIALDGFYINALMLATGITKQDVPKWVQSAVDAWAAFDSELPIIKQVKLLIVRELTKPFVLTTAG